MARHFRRARQRPVSCPVLSCSTQLPYTLEGCALALDAAATKAWMGALLGLVFLARAAQGTTPINDLKFSHDRKGAQYEFSFEDVLTENARSLVEAFGRRIRDSDEPFYTEDGLKTMSTLGSPSAPRRRMFVARLQNPGNRPEARHFNQGDGPPRRLVDAAADGKGWDHQPRHLGWGVPERSSVSQSRCCLASCSPR